MKKRDRLKLGNKDVSTKALRTKMSTELSTDFNQDIYVTEQDILDALELSAGSKEAAKFVVPFARGLAKTLGLKSSAAVSDASTKLLKRIFSKAITQYEKIVSDVPDIGRMRLLIEKPEDIENLRNILLGANPTYTDKRIGDIVDKNPTNEITIDEVEDFYHVPSSTGRIGMHITLLVKIFGNIIVPFEIQVLHKDMVKTEELTRDNYMKAQEIKRVAKAQGRSLTESEQDSVDGYDASSRERYTADAIHLDLFDLRRKDLTNTKIKRVVTENVRRLHLVPPAA